MSTSKIVDKIKNTNWDQLDNQGFPFLSHKFFNALESSKSIGLDTGWSPVYICDDGQSAMFTFIKEHSYGEYIFDWDWAHFYRQYNVAYYPKLTSMVPFTSVTTPHFLGEHSRSLMEAYHDFYEGNDFSSSHFLFLTKSEIDFFRSFDYIIRDSFQYHFINNSYTCFESFLRSLKNKKAKQIRKERIFPDNISFNQFTANDLTVDHADEMYGFYLSTIRNKNAIPYLTKEFFLKAFEKLKDNIYYVQAVKEDRVIAGSLYFYSDERLYGRYWGALENIPNLHFELCFYQGIEFCIKKGFSVFEAGAQGEHKISRGFRPVKTYSAHKFKHQEFHSAIENYIKEERERINLLIPQLNQRLPFKSISNV